MYLYVHIINTYTYIYKRMYVPYTFYTTGDSNIKTKIAIVENNNG